jgi:hypothetical protein
MSLNISEKISQEQLKVILKEMCFRGQEDETLETNEMIKEIKHKLINAIEKN